MPENTQADRPRPSRPTFAWWAVLCLVGLDYFSSLAYLPSLALEGNNALAPLAAIGVVAITLLVALPVYCYIAGRSTDGHGGLGLLEKHVHGWTGKFLILFMLGFVATDFVVTRSLSVADAATHLLANPIWKEHAQNVIKNKETIRTSLPESLQGRFFDFWSEQVILSIVLSIVAFSLYFFLVNRLNRGFLSIAVAVVVLYLGLTAVVVASGLLHIRDNPELLTQFETQLKKWEPEQFISGQQRLGLAILALLSFPPLALGLSGFELSLASAPLVRGNLNDSRDKPTGRITRVRILLVVAAVLMSLFVFSSVLVVSTLVDINHLRVNPNDPTSPVQHRALSYLAHGGQFTRGPAGVPLNPFFGEIFGSIYDLSTVMILCLAGASATISLRDIVPDFLTRFGMQLEWAHKVGVIVHLFNVVILIVTVAFHASVDAQQGAYATSVLVLMMSASLAALLDVRAHWGRTLSSWFVSLPFALATLLFLLMAMLIALQNFSGVGIALIFVAVVFLTAMLSRWVRSTELRFEDFVFEDEHSRKRWQDICQLDFQILVPHKVGYHTLAEKEADIRRRHRLDQSVPILFVHVQLGDTSEFCQAPVMKIEVIEGREVITVSRCNSIAHALAAMGLAFREVGQPPEIHFAWSNKSPHTATLGFLLFGQGNVPWMVRELLRKAEHDPNRRPRVIVG